MSSSAVLVTASDYIKKRVTVITAQGRHFLGTLESCDQLSNLVLSSCVERVYDAANGGAVSEDPLGAYAIRGQQVVLIGQVDTIEEASLDLSTVRGDPLPPCTAFA